MPAALSDVLPDDMEVVRERPDVGAALVGKVVVVKWRVVVWCIGTITKFYPKPRTKAK